MLSVAIMYGDIMLGIKLNSLTLVCLFEILKATVIPVLQNAIKDRILQVQVAAKQALAQWN